MAKKKGKKKPGKLERLPSGDELMPPGMLEQLLGMIPEDLREQLMVEMLVGMDEDFSPPRPKKAHTKAQREIDKLVSQARQQPTAEAAIPLLIKAESIARQALGKRLETITGPLGRAPAEQAWLEVKAELVEAYSADGDRQAAVAHAEEVLRLDPGPPDRVRILLLAAYLDLGRNDDADLLLQEGGAEPWAAWLFGRVLVDLRRGVRGGPLDDQLRRAHRANPFVLSLLLGLRMPEPNSPFPIAEGEESEAQEYVQDFLVAWKDTPGAVSWLREASVRLKLDVEAPDDEPAAPIRLTKSEYAELPPHEHSTWIAGMYEMPPTRLPGEDEPQKRWMVFAFSAHGDLIGFDVDQRRPKPRELWDRLVEFMVEGESPGRPAEILLFPVELTDRLKKEANKARIEVLPYLQSGQLLEMLGQLGERMQGGAMAAESLDPDAVRRAPLDVDDVWEAALLPLEQRVTVANISIRPWVALVMSRASEAVLWNEVFTESPADDALSIAVRMAIVRPSFGSSHRPRQILVLDHDQAVSLRALSDEGGFNVSVEPELPLVADAVAGLTQEVMGGEPLIVLTKADGVTPADLEAFYTAAAEYYRAQPWKRFAMDEAVALDWSPWSGERHYALVMGQSGITQGLAVYQSLDNIKSLLEAQTEDLSFDSFSVVFGEDLEVAPADMDAIEQFGWPIATPEAYPNAMRALPGERVKTPTAAELRFLTAVLLAITWFSQNRDQKTTALATPAGDLRAARLGSVEAATDESGPS